VVRITSRLLLFRWVLTANKVIGRLIFSRGKQGERP
jgi:hypothetical protein